jgi:hypothetical protein
MPLRPGDVIRLAESRIVVAEPGSELPAQGIGDGLTGGTDERLPESTIFRPASELLAAPAVAAESGGLAARMRLLNEVHRALAAPITLEALGLILDRVFATSSPEGAVFTRRPGRSSAWRSGGPGITGCPLAGWRR